MTVMNELKRIYNRESPKGEATWVDDFSDTERAVWERMPDELKGLALFVGYDSGLPHDDVHEIFGAYTLVEYNSDDGTFGQLRNIVEDYAFDQVLIIGADTYLDVAGQIGEPGSIHQTISYDLDCATPLAPSLLSLLESCGAFGDS